MDIESYLQATPKAELHVHLEGAIQPETILALAKRNKVALPVKNVQEFRQKLVYRDFDSFVDVFLMGIRCLKTSEDYEQIVYEFGAEMARQNVHYAEVNVTPSTHHLAGVPYDVYFSGMQRGRARTLTNFGVQINWIFSIVRKWNDTTRTLPMADYATSVAIEGKNDGVVALGLGGSEEGASPELFAPWFEKARTEGLHSAPHAGEMAGPASIWGAISTLGAERIAHGVRAIEDLALIDYLVQHHIPLDITPTSNIFLGVYPSYHTHPLSQLYKAGAIITVSTDDPPLFNTTLTQEVSLLATKFDLDIAAIDEILLNGIRYSFLPEQQRQQLETDFQAELDILKARYLTDKT